MVTNVKVFKPWVFGFIMTKYSIRFEEGARGIEAHGIHFSKCYKDGRKISWKNSRMCQLPVEIPFRIIRMHEEILDELRNLLPGEGVKLNKVTLEYEVDN